MGNAVTKYICKGDRLMYDGYLIKLGNEIIPLNFIKVKTYIVSPQQRLETAAERDATGMLHRTTVAHTPSKIEFQTPNLRNAEVSALVDLIRRNYTNYTQRNVSVTYYNPETDSYLSGTFYMPDVQYTIYSIDGDTVMYDPIRYAFIEY